MLAFSKMINEVMLDVIVNVELLIEAAVPYIVVFEPVCGAISSVIFQKVPCRQIDCALFLIASLMCWYVKSSLWNVVVVVPALTVTHRSETHAVNSQKYKPYTIPLMIHVWRMVAENCTWRLISKHWVWHQPDAHQMPARRQTDAARLKTIPKVRFSKSRIRGSILDSTPRV